MNLLKHRLLLAVLAACFGMAAVVSFTFASNSYIDSLVAPTPAAASRTKVSSPTMPVPGGKAVEVLASAARKAAAPAAATVPLAVKPVPSLDTAFFSKLIDQKIETLLASGVLKGEKGDKGDIGSSGPQGPAGYSPILLPSNPAALNNSQITTSLGATDITGTNLTGDTLTSKTGRFSESVNIQGNLTAGQTSLATTTVSSLTVSTATAGSILPGVSGSLRQTVITQIAAAAGSSYIYNDNQKFVAVGTDGYVRFVYMDWSSYELHYVHCLDLDCQTKNDKVISTNSNGSDAPTLSIASDGLPRIVYINYNTPNELHFVRCLDQDCNALTDTLVDHPAHGYFWNVSGTVDKDGLGRIVYEDYPQYQHPDPSQDYLKFAACLNADCTSVATTTVATSSTSWLEQSAIAVGSDNTARFVYINQDTTPNQIHYVVCQDASCTVRSDQLVGTVARGYYIDMVLGTDGYGRIVYTDDSSAIKFIQCTNAACSLSNTTTLASVANASQVTVIMDNNNLPRISYGAWNWPKGAGVFYIQCKTANCSEKSLASISFTGGGLNSMALGLDGYPRIVYGDLGSKVLKLARLVTEDGSTYAAGSSLGTSNNSFGDLYVNRLFVNGSLAGNWQELLNGQSYTQDIVSIGTTSMASILNVGGGTNAVFYTSGFGNSNSPSSTPFASFYGQNGGWSFLQVGEDRYAANTAIQFSNINASNINQSRSWIGAEYNWRFSSNLALFVSKDGNVARRPEDSLRGLTLTTGYDETNTYVYSWFNGSLSVGTTTPSDPGANNLYVQGDAKIGGKIMVAESTGTSGGGYSFYQDGGYDTGMFSPSDGTISFYTNGSESVRLRWDGHVGIGTTDASHLLTLSGGAYSDGSVWSNASDVNLKENFATVTPAEILQKIASLPISQWNYKADSATTTHIGPTAQDFYAAFGLGGEHASTSISTIDPSGVALLGIQALNQKIADLQGSIIGNATASSLSVYVSSNFSGDSVGEAKILAGQTSVRVTFKQAYKYQPVVTFSPEGAAVLAFIQSKDASGFTLSLPQATTTDVVFDWHSFASPEAQLTVSDGSTQNIILIQPQIIPPQSGQTGNGQEGGAQADLVVVTQEQPAVVDSQTTEPVQPVDAVPNEQATSTLPVVEPTPEVVTEPEAISSIATE